MIPGSSPTVPAQAINVYIKTYGTKLLQSIKEFYPDCKCKGNQGYFELTDMQPMIDSLGYENLTQLTHLRYNGDVCLVFRDGSRYGILDGHGVHFDPKDAVLPSHLIRRRDAYTPPSVTYYSALYHCGSYEDLSSLRIKMLGNIQWWGNKDGIISYLRNCSGPYGVWRNYHSAARVFANTALEYLDDTN